MLFQLNTALWDIGSPLKKCFCIFQKMISNFWIYSLLPAGLFNPNLNFELINHARNENIVLLREGGENERISHTVFLDLFSIACWFIQA